MRLVVPNGLLKLIIPFRNGVTGTISNHTHQSNEGKSKCTDDGTEKAALSEAAFSCCRV